MKIFKHRIFHKWAESEKLTNKILKQAINELEEGLYEASLGSNLYKKRIAMPGKGKRSGYRTLVAVKQNEVAFFIYGYAKNVCDDIGEDDLKLYRALAKDLLSLDKIDIEVMLERNKLFEVK